MSGHKRTSKQKKGFGNLNPILIHAASTKTTVGVAVCHRRFIFFVFFVLFVIIIATLFVGVGIDISDWFAV
jgi:hypothetical protein